MVEARAEARRLIATLDPPTRELIYRLSLTVQALPHQQVLAIARQPAPIVEPGLAFDRLIGPWMEVVAEGLSLDVQRHHVGAASRIQIRGWA